MNAWQRLLAASTLTAGTAWGLITHPKLDSGVIVNDGIEMEVEIMTMDAEIDDNEVTLDVNLESVEVQLSDNELTIEVEEW